MWPFKPRNHATKEKNVAHNSKTDGGLPEILDIEKPEPAKRRTKQTQERHDFLANAPIGKGFKISEAEFTGKWRRVIKDFMAENPGSAFSNLDYDGGKLIWRDS